VEALGTARLADMVPADRAVAATIPRQEIAAALADREGTPELVLQVVPPGGAAAEPAAVSMAWSRDDLERLLGSSDGDVVLTFDRDQLTAAIDDVEAHGMRARAAVFTVAAIGALGTGASIANAMHTADGGDLATPAAVASIDRTLTDSSSGSGYAVAPSAADSMVTDASSGGYTAPAQTAAADSMVTDASSAGGYAAPAQTGADSMVTDASSAGGYTAAADASSADTLRTDVSSGGGYAPAPSSSDGSFFDVHSPSTTDALLAAGLLAIAGASFATRRVGTARPA
jgi:hypothetical protein